jgi:hypothetical protein
MCYHWSVRCRHLGTEGAKALLMSTVFSWWYLLCGVAALNILLWSLSAAVLKRQQTALSSESYSSCRLQMALSALYVFGCAFRSVIPVFDVPRIALFDTWLSSVIVGRSVATVAELAFVMQWALLLRASARATGAITAKVVSRAVVPLIVVAEICSWYSVLTTSNIGHVIEESIWGASAALLVISMMGIWPRCPANWRPALVAGCVAAIAYVAYMFFVDVPMYWARYVADEASGRQYLSLFHGVIDVSERRVVSHRWEDWKSEVIWMTLYFSVAVWISISLIFASKRVLLRQRNGSKAAQATQAFLLGRNGRPRWHGR